MHGFGGRIIQKQHQQTISEEEIKYKERQGQHPDHFDSRFETAFDPFRFFRAKILGCIIGDTVSQSCKRCNDQIISLTAAEYPAITLAPKLLMTP